MTLTRTGFMPTFQCKLDRLFFGFSLINSSVIIHGRKPIPTGTSEPTEEEAG
jgi:hypothetical protein